MARSAQAKVCTSRFSDVMKPLGFFLEAEDGGGGSTILAWHDMWAARRMARHDAAPAAATHYCGCCCSPLPLKNERHESALCFCSISMRANRALLLKLFWSLRFLTLVFSSSARGVGWS